MNLGFIAAALLFTATPNARRAAPLPSIECSAIVPAPPEKVWDAFTTTEGVKSWMVALADIDMKIGGLWKTKYRNVGTLGDEGTIVNEVLSYDPGRMFSIRIHTPPKGFPFMKSYKEMWTVVYFEAAGEGRTKVTCRGHGFTDEEESKKLRSFFEGGNRQTLEMLAKHFEKK
jgi:uncharacterized protein YndB with AHSA1/START domain